MKRMIIPFSSSSFLLFSPWGIHVARTESLLFRLLKAVLIPITIKYLLLLEDSAFLKSSDKGEPPSIDS
uniref:Putative beta-1 3-galactosyltransferase 2 isoform X3 n=1 Tax=Rhizophora mucronata TaxID=61149 RepID=A0A2P2KAB5_RHIMU